METNLKIGGSILGSKYKIGDKIEGVGIVAGYDKCEENIIHNLIVAYEDGIGWESLDEFDFICKDINSLHGYTYLELNGEDDYNEED